jgi:hypothetical protein
MGLTGQSIMRSAPEWVATRDDRNECYEIGYRLPVGRRIIATVEFGYDEPAETESHEAAALITAAPDLFAALQAAQKRLEQIDDDCQPALDVRLQIGAALAKAVQSATCSCGQRGCSQCGEDPAAYLGAPSR